jgi:hypothetical protein
LFLLYLPSRFPQCIEQFMDFAVENAKGFARLSVIFDATRGQSVAGAVGLKEEIGGNICGR